MADNSRPRSSHMHFSVKTRDNVVYGLSMQASTTIKELKDKLLSQVNVSPDRQRLIFSGRVLRDGRTIDDYNIRNGNVVHLVISGAVRAAPAASTVTVSSCPSAAIVAAFEAQSVPTRSSAGPGSDSRPALSSAGDADRLAHDNDQELLDSIIRHLEDPQYQSLVDHALANPRVIESIINSDPVLLSMGASAYHLMSSPQFRRMASDPNPLRHLFWLRESIAAVGSNVSSTENENHASEVPPSEIRSADTGFSGSAEQDPGSPLAVSDHNSHTATISDPNGAGHSSNTNDLDSARPANGTNGTSLSGRVNGTNGTNGPNNARPASGTNGTSLSGRVNGTNGTNGPNNARPASGTNGTSLSGRVNGTNGTNGSNGARPASGTNGNRPGRSNGSNGSTRRRRSNGTHGPNRSRRSNGTNGSSGARPSSDTNGYNEAESLNGARPTNGTNGSGAGGQSRGSSSVQRVLVHRFATLPRANPARNNQSQPSSSQPSSSPQRTPSAYPIGSRQRRRQMRAQLEQQRTFQPQHDLSVLDEDTLIQFIEAINAASRSSQAVVVSDSTTQRIPSALLNVATRQANEDANMAGSTNAAPDVQTPQERYRHQLSWLSILGFHNLDRNVEALVDSNGNIREAIEYLQTP